MLHVLGQAVEGTLRLLTCDVKTNRRIKTANGKLYMLSFQWLKRENKKRFEKADG